MRIMKTTLVIIVSIAFCFSACQQRQRAELHALYLANEALETQIHTLSGRQQGFLNNCNMIIRTSTDRKAKRAELNLWQHLVIETDLQLRAIEKIKTQCLKKVGANNAYFATLFVEQGQQQIDATPWANKVQKIKAYADSLYRVNPQAIKIFPKQGVLSGKLPWTLFYSELNQWKLALLKVTQNILESQPWYSKITAYKYNSLNVFLEIIPETHCTRGARVCSHHAAFGLGGE